MNLNPQLTNSGREWDETGVLIDHDTAAAIQSMFGIVSRVSQTVLSGMSSRPRRPSGHVIGDVWDCKPLSSA